jgi:hypothetical protein
MSSWDIPEGDLATFAWCTAATVGVFVFLMSGFGLLGLPGLALIIFIAMLSGWCSLVLAVLAILYLWKTTSLLIGRLYWSMFAITIAGLVTMIRLALSTDDGWAFVSVAFIGGKGLGPTFADNLYVNLITGPALLFFFLASFIRRPPPPTRPVPVRPPPRTS